jgi:hypothetical protein
MRALRRPCSGRLESYGLADTLALFDMNGGSVPADVAQGCIDLDEAAGAEGSRWSARAPGRPLSLLAPSKALERVVEFGQNAVDAVFSGSGVSSASGVTSTPTATSAAMDGHDERV